MCFRLVAGCRRESIPALRVPPLFLFPCSSIPLALAPSAALCVAVSLSLFLFRFASSRSCPPPRVLLSSFLSTVFLDVRIHFPSFTVHCPPYSPNMSSFGPCCSIFLISDALSRVRFIHLLSPSALSFNSLSVLFPFFFLVYRSYFLAYSRIIGPSSFSSNLSFFSRFFLFRFFLSPFTFNLLCIIVFGLSLPFFRLLGFSFSPFISRALYSLFRMSFLPFVYSFFVILFDFSSVFLSTNPSRISLSTCSKKVDARGNMDEKRESNEHGVEFGIECITRVTPTSKGCSSDLRSFEKMDRNTK